MSIVKMEDKTYQYLNDLREFWFKHGLNDHLLKVVSSNLMVVAEVVGEALAEERRCKISGRV